MRHSFLKTLRKSVLGLSIFLTTVFAFSASTFAKPVALNIVLDDQIAVRASSNAILEKLFAEHSPETEFRSVVVRVRRDAGVESDADRARIHEELKEKIRASLKPGDEMKYLILNTHGNTSNNITSLRHLGYLAFFGPTQNFQDLFDSVKPYASKDLAIIMSACSVFADNQEESALRAKELLAYFGAPDGLVYGSTKSEVDLLRFRRDYFSIKNVFTAKQIAANTALSSLAATVFGCLMAIGPHHLHAGLVTAEYTMVAFTAFQYLLQTFGHSIADSLGRINVGYLFEFQGSDIKQVEIIRKMKDIAKSYGLKRSSSAGHATLRCEVVHF